MFSDNELLSMAIYLGLVAAVLLVSFLVSSGLFVSQRRAIARLRNLSNDKATEQTTSIAASLYSMLRGIGNFLVPQEEDKRVTELKRDMLRAGIYGANSVRVFMGAKLLLMVFLPIPFAVLPYVWGMVTLLHAILALLLATCLGMFLPKAWLSHKVKSRQRSLRRAIPDVLDMMVLCLEGGISMAAAIARVTGELRVVHPGLAAEMNILQREVQLGLTVGQALQSFAERCDLDEVQDLASVLLQSERIGASVGQALRTHADMCRLDRQQRAEETAHKAAVKILFPTMLCILPAIFVVLLGPAAIQIGNLFSK